MKRETFLCKSHPDYHLPASFDAGEGFDGDAYASKLKDSGVDAIVFFAKCHYGHAYYDTALGTPHPRLRKDMLREVERGCHAHGLGLIAYFSVFLDSAAAKAHPDWALHNRAPSATDAGFDSGKFRMICVNSGYLEELFIPQAVEVATRYDVDELFFDTMTGFQPCYCANCVRAFGQPIPGVESPDWSSYVHWYSDCYSRFFARSAEAIHAAQPDIGITYNWEWGIRRPTSPPAHITRLGADLIASGHIAAQHSRYFAGSGMPSDYMTGRFMHGLGDWNSNTPESILHTAAVTVANGSSFYIIDRQLPDGTLEPRAYDMMRTVFAFIQERREVLENARHVPEIAVLHSYASIMGPNLEFFPDREVRKKRMETFEGVVRLFTEHGRHFTVHSAETLLTRLDDYRVVVLPEQEYLDAPLVASLQQFVEEGGRLIVTQAAVAESVDPAVLALAGVRYGGHEERDYCYLAGPQPIALRARMAKVTLTGAETFCASILPLDLKGGESFGHGFAPPAAEGPHPAATRHKVGRGEVVYVAVPFFKTYANFQNAHAAKLFLAWLDQLLPDPMARVSTPAQVEMALLRKGDDLIVHLVNHSGRERLAGYFFPMTEYLPEIRDIKLAIRWPEPTRKILSMPGKTELAWEADGEYVMVTVPPLQVMQSVLVPEYFRASA